MRPGGFKNYTLKNGYFTPNSGALYPETQDRLRFFARNCQLNLNGLVHCRVKDIAQARFCELTFERQGRFFFTMHEMNTVSPALACFGVFDQ